MIIPLQVFDICFNQGHIIIACRKKVVTVYLCEKQIETCFPNFGIQETHIAEEFRASYLEPTDIIGVVGDAHGIGIRVDGPDFNRSVSQ